MTDPTTVTIRLPLTALLGIFGLIVCMTPVAFGVPGLQVLYLVPLTLGLWLVRTRTVVGPETVVAHRLWGTQRMSWSDLAGLRVDSQSRIWAVPHAGDEIGLPAVRARHLPILAAISGSRLPANLAESDERPTAHS